MSGSRTITWLHLSDLHFRESRAYDEHVVLKALLLDVADRIRDDGLHPDFIILSGDVAFSGRAEEYALAQQFLDDLLETTSLSKEHLFLVPGNHDVDRSTVSAAAASVTSTLNNRNAVNRFLASDSDRALVLQRFRNYRDFVNQYLGLCSDDSAYFYVKSIEVADKHIAILGLNSAWGSASDADRGSLLLGERQVRGALDMAEGADLRFAVMHHPFDWLQEFDHNDVEPLLLNGCHFVLHGHMHQAGLLQAQTPDTETMVIATGACYETRQYPNSYNFVQLDLNAGKGSVFLRLYSDRRGGFWTKDVVNYLNVPDGVYAFPLPAHLRHIDRRVRVPVVQTVARPQIFLSYVREDGTEVERLYQQLSDAGFNPWMDRQDILPGERWADSISRAIRRSDFFLACLSAQSISKRGFIHKEIKIALEIVREMLGSDIYLIPVRLEDCAVPENLHGLHWVDLFEEDGWTRLLKALQVGMDRRGIRFTPEVVPKSVLQIEAEAPRGFSLQRTFSDHKDVITRIGWSVDGQSLASASHDHTVRLWNLETGKEQLALKGHTDWINAAVVIPNSRLAVSASRDTTLKVWDLEDGAELYTLRGHNAPVDAVAVTPDGQLAISASWDKTLKVWDLGSWAELFTLRGHTAGVRSVAVTADGKRLISASYDGILKVWDLETRAELFTLRGHAGDVTAISLAPDGRTLASASVDNTIRLWDIETGRQTGVLEGHTGAVTSVSFSYEGRVLASKSQDNTVRLWSCDNWQTLAVLNEVHSGRLFPSLAFHPIRPLLATLGGEDTKIRIWDLDFDILLSGIVAIPSVHQINAKVVLLGESGVGKSGLGIRIVEDRFYPTESSHGAQFWQVSVPSDKVDSLSKLHDVQAEITLWDLAGQPDYHLIHQLFLDDTNVALLLFDCPDPADPFRGVPYWAKVLEKQAPPNILKLLVSSRCDVSPVTVDQYEINRFMSEYGLHAHLRTSAKTGAGVEALIQRVLEGIPWDELSRTSTPRLFQVVRDFLLERKELGSTLIPLSGIWNEASERYTERAATQAEIDAVVDLLQSQGLIHRLNPTPKVSWVLLWPERINQYASAIIKAAHDHPHGIGAIPEHEVIRADLPFNFERLEPFEEQVVLESTVELLIRHNLCFREMGLLVFPTQLNVTRPLSDEDKHPRAEVTYQFSGSVEAIYASLVVRLGNTKYFQRESQWKYAAEFSRNGYKLGFAMRQVEQGTGELEIYFHPGVSDFDRVIFIRFITDHLKAKGIDIQERIPIYCPECGREITNRDAIRERVRAGKLDIPCQYCYIPVIIPRSIEELYRSDPSYAETQGQLTQTAEEHTEQEVQAFKLDKLEYTRDQDHFMHILHLSDIHLEAGSDPLQHLIKLEVDLKRELGVGRLEYLVISGDITHYSTPDEYKVAFDFIDDLVKRFGLDSSRVVIVPGNHDVNWDLSRQAYPFVYYDQLPTPLAEGRYIPAGEEGALLRNDQLYQQRLVNFAHFYRQAYSGTDYPLDYAQQGILHPSAKDRIVFLALNSCWEIDHYKPHRARASINESALARPLDELLDDKYRDWLKIAVWHHPVTGPNTMKKIAFLEQLVVGDFQICMHGHVHEAQNDYFRYDYGRGLYIIGAGTFGAPPKEQVTGIPLQYNLLVLDPETRTITVETRKKEKPDGAWSADARWGDKNNPVPRYTIQLK